MLELERIESYKELVLLTKSHECSTILEAYAFGSFFKKGLMYTRPVWTYGQTNLFETDKYEIHLREAHAAYSDRIEYIKSVFEIMKDDILKNPRMIENIDKQTLENESKYGQWRTQNQKSIRKSREVLEERDNSTSDEFIKCFKCKSNSVDTEQKQTRSADEPMTIFCECKNCGSRWTM